jgi:tetratricopeptide (TPR) repeat protein
MKTLLRVLALCLATLACSAAAAQESPAAARDAGRHFQRGVTLYAEADYRAALVEFRRAYAIAPHAAVLYNVGEAQYQLQDYASALTTFERYLAESTPNDTRRTEVEATVETLRSRVGHVTIVTLPPGADITIDDQATGKTPIDRPVLVSIGRRKVVATIPGRPPVTRTVDVATDDNLTVTLQLPDASTATPTAGAKTSLPLLPPDTPAPSHTGAIWRGIGWTATGLLTVGAITFGVLADKASNDLTTARATYPTSQSTLEHDASLTSTYSIVADSLAIGACLLGGITLLTSLTSSPDEPRDRGGAARVSVGPGSARLEVSF